jgi:transposase
MSDHHFWLSDAQFARLQPLLPNKSRGVPRVDHRRVISGIVHVIRDGFMWRDAPAAYGPHETLHHRFVRRSRAGVFDRIFARPAKLFKDASLKIKSSAIKGRRLPSRWSR